MTHRIVAACLAAGVAILAATAAQAAVITDLFNTGTDAANVALVGGNDLVDPHYVIESSTSPGFAGQAARTYYNGAYLADDANSRWISLTGSGTPANNTTTYRLTFDLTGLDPATAQITGRFAADNSASILLNGAATGVSAGGFSSYSNFLIDSGFVSGLNTLDFRVVDVGVVTALRVDDLAGAAELAVPSAGGVPEPSAWMLMIMGFGLAGAGLRRRTRGGFRGPRASSPLRRTAAAAAAAALGLGWAGQVSAGTIMEVVYYGEVIDGYDQGGLFGAPDQLFGGETFLATFRFDLGLGARTTSPGNDLVSGYGGDSPILLASLAIDGAGQAIDRAGMGQGYAQNGPDFVEHYAENNLGSQLHLFMGLPFAPGALTDAYLLSPVEGLSCIGCYGFQFFDQDGGYAYGRLKTLGVAAGYVAAPEPSAWALIVLGSGAAGAMVRRRRTLTAPSA